jgi:hypothetical protein
LRLAASFTLLLTISPFAPARAEDRWREFRPDDGGFTVMMPQGEPEVIDRPVKDETRTTRRHYHLRAAGTSYFVTIIQFKEGSLESIGASFLLNAENRTDSKSGDKDRKLKLGGHSAGGDRDGQRQGSCRDAQGLYRR